MTVSATYDADRLASNARQGGLVSAGTGTAAARGGIECKFNYGGITINDRSLLERIEVTNTTGFQGDISIRDTRESKPSDHGDILGKAFYDGRTMTLQGKIVAYNLKKLRDMQEALDSAFNDIEAGEQPLTITSALGQAVTINAMATAISGPEQQDDLTWRRDFMITLRASNPRLVSTTLKNFTILPGISPNPQFEDSISDVMVQKVTGSSAGATASLVQTSDPSLIDQGKGGAVVSLQNTTGASAAGYLYTMAQRTVVTGNKIYLKAKVTGQGTAPLPVTLGYFTQAGVFSTSGVVGVNGGNVKTTSGGTYLEAVLTVPAGVTKVSPAIAFTVAAGATTVWGVDGFNGAPTTGAALTNLDMVAVDNLGNFHGQPFFTVNGPWNWLNIRNLTTGKQIHLGAIANGEIIYIDTARRRIYSSTGMRFDLWDQTNSWLTVKKRATNYISVDGPGATDTSTVLLATRDTWM